MYLDGSGQVRFLLAEVEEPGNRHSIGQIVDKGHVVDQVVHLSNAQDDNGGNALREMKVGRVTKKDAEYLRHPSCVSAVSALRGRGSRGDSTYAEQQGGDWGAVF